jgi:hypothetical protein
MKLTTGFEQLRTVAMLFAVMALAVALMSGTAPAKGKPAGKGNPEELRECQTERKCPRCGRKTDPDEAAVIKIGRRQR